MRRDGRLAKKPSPLHSSSRRCAVRELDPSGKFRGDSIIWDWSGLDVSETGPCCLRAAAAMAAGQSSPPAPSAAPPLRPPRRNRWFGSFAR